MHVVCWLPRLHASLKYLGRPMFGYGDQLQPGKLPTRCWWAQLANGGHLWLTGSIATWQASQSHVLVGLVGDSGQQRVIHFAPPCTSLSLSLCLCAAISFHMPFIMFSLTVPSHFTQIPWCLVRAYSQFQYVIVLVNLWK